MPYIMFIFYHFFASNLTRILNAQKGIPQTANGKLQTAVCSPWKTSILRCLMSQKLRSSGRIKFCKRNQPSKKAKTSPENIMRFCNIFFQSFQVIWLAKYLSYNCISPEKKIENLPCSRCPQNCKTRHFTS